MIQGWCEIRLHPSVKGYELIRAQHLNNNVACGAIVFTF